MGCQASFVIRFFILIFGFTYVVNLSASDCPLTQADIDQIKKYVPCLVSENRLACGSIVGVSALASAGLLAPTVLKTYLVKSIEKNREKILASLASDIENTTLSANAVSNSKDYAKYIQELEDEVDDLYKNREELLKKIEARKNNPGLRADDRVIMKRTEKGLVFDSLSGSKDEALKESLESINNQIADKNLNIRTAKQSLNAGKAPFFKIIPNLKNESASLANAIYEKIVSGAKAGEDIFSTRFLNSTVNTLDISLKRFSGAQFMNIVKRSVFSGIALTTQAIQATRGFGAAALKTVRAIQSTIAGRALSTAAGRVFTSTAGRIFVGATSLSATLLTYSGDVSAADFREYYNGEIDPAPNPPVLTPKALEGIDRSSVDIYNETRYNQKSCEFYKGLCTSYAQCGDKIEKPVCYGNKATLKIKSADRKVYEQTYIFAEGSQEGLPIVRTVISENAGNTIQKNYTDEGKIVSQDKETIDINDIFTSKYATMVAAICKAPAQEQAQILASFRVQAKKRAGQGVR